MEKSWIEAERKASRPLADFPAGVGEEYLSSSWIPHTDHMTKEAYTERLSSLKKQVMELFTVSKANPIESIKFIDTLCRLGVSYHFEKEIEEQLGKIFASRDFHGIIRSEECDLCTVGLAFQVFRQFGFKLSADVFDKFKDEDGKLKGNHGADAKGMVSLYEASHWRTHGEDFLDEAAVFSTTVLEDLSSRCSPHLATRIKNALRHPYHKGIPRIEARQYISYYEEEEMRDETLLEFAKVDFNVLQLLHLEEIALVSRWYNDLRIESNVPYARNRTVEAFLWALGTYFEPKYSRARVTLAIVILIITLIDDTYDAYGTLEELELFTDALDTWLPAAPHVLPDSMKHVYHIMIDFYDKMEKEMEEEGRSGCGFYLKKLLKMLGKSYNREAEWLNKDYIPMFEEYKENGALSSAILSVVAASIVGMERVGNVDAFKWLSSRPKPLLAAEVIGRFKDDIAGYEMEHKRKHVGTAIDCYMKQYGVSKGKATEEIRNMISDSWKDLNGELMRRPHSVPFPLLIGILNVTRACEVFYKYGDGYTEPEYVKEYIVSLFGQNIPI
ncbi:PREDICTED: alpha-humulene/(-)-(E)-beta-caryophyllene synthase-like [Tarenaya hassleriana]|uniref:alpha-humulene/(-)-(E)-beta-caryophyllene synthase-like n=1 Tax=Tarenaya hassleriana TaxID=28532 RepID=UPI00053C1778|nr:PREDICTED: alpha-humulene/(-)-(E)-beta-caryophyllene synthase-like [Tarenaya hassleriana]